MFSFAYPVRLFALLLIPAFLGLYFWARHARKVKLRRFGKPEALSSLMPQVSPYKPAVKVTVAMIALAMLVIAWARPWGAVREETRNTRGIEVVIAVDVSNSMLASATSEVDGTQRMRSAKTFLERLINELDNDRVGLVVYAGNAGILLPLTSDFQSAKGYLNSIDPGFLEDQGTNIADAVSVATRMFRQGDDIGKAIILITDAEELTDAEQVKENIKEAAGAKIQVDVIGVGTTSAVPIPTAQGNMIDYETGDEVRTALNEQLAQQMAKDGKGIYVNASNPEALAELTKQLQTLKKASLQSSVMVNHDELYPVFLWIALAMILADFFLLDRKIGWLSKINFFKKEVRR